MSEYTKHLTPRPELRERIIDCGEGLCCARYQKYYDG